MLKRNEKLRIIIRGLKTTNDNMKARSSCAGIVFTATLFI